MCVSVSLYMFCQSVFLCVCHYSKNKTTFTLTSTVHIFSQTLKTTQKNKPNNKTQHPIHNAIQSPLHLLSFPFYSLVISPRPRAPSSPTRPADLRQSFRPCRGRCTPQSRRGWAWGLRRRSPCRACPGRCCCLPYCPCFARRPTASLAACSWHVHKQD